MFTLNQLILGWVLPAVITAGLILLLNRRAWSAALAVGAAFITGYAGIIAWPTFQPADSLEWIWLIAIAASILGSLQSTQRAPMALVPIVAAGAMVLLTRPLFQHTWDGLTGVIWISALATGISLIWLGLAGIERRAGARSFAIALFLISAASSVCHLLSASLKLAQMASILSVIMLAMVVLSFWTRHQRGVAIIFVMLLASLNAYSHLFGSMSMTTAALLTVSPLAMFAGDIPKIPSSQRSIARIVGVMTPIAIAVYFAYLQYAERSTGSGGYY